MFKLWRESSVQCSSMLTGYLGLGPWRSVWVFVRRRTVMPTSISTAAGMSS